MSYYQREPKAPHTRHDRELEMISRRPPVPFVPVLLPSPLTKGDVPIGTEVWYYPTPQDTYAPERIA